MQVLEEQLHLLRSGNTEVFEKIFNEYSEKVYFFTLKQTQSSYLAEEVTQLTFYKLWKYRGTLAQNLDINIQIFRIARTSLIDEIRKRNNHLALLKNLTTDDKPLNTITEKLESRQKLENVLASFKRFPPVRKKIFEMSRLESLSYDEIATRLSISKKTVEKHISIALKSLRDEFMVFIILLIHIWTK